MSTVIRSALSFILCPPRCHSWAQLCLARAESTYEWESSPCVTPEPLRGPWRMPRREGAGMAGTAKRTGGLPRNRCTSGAAVPAVGQRRPPLQPPAAQERRGVTAAARQRDPVPARGPAAARWQAARSPGRAPSSGPCVQTMRRNRLNWCPGGTQKTSSRNVKSSRLGAHVVFFPRFTTTLGGGFFTAGPTAGPAAAAGRCSAANPVGGLRGAVSALAPCAADDSPAPSCERDSAQCVRGVQRGVSATTPLTHRLRVTSLPDPAGTHRCAVGGLRRPHAVPQ